jgi:hypothetical protein
MRAKNSWTFSQSENGLKLPFSAHASAFHVTAEFKGPPLSNAVSPFALALRRNSLKASRQFIGEDAIRKLEIFG